MPLLAATPAEKIHRLWHLTDGAAFPTVRAKVIADTSVIRAPDALLTPFGNVAVHCWLASPPTSANPARSPPSATPSSQARLRRDPREGRPSASSAHRLTGPPAHRPNQPTAVPSRHGQLFGSTGRSPPGPAADTRTECPLSAPEPHPSTCDSRRASHPVHTRPDAFLSPPKPPHIL